MSAAELSKRCAANITYVMKSGARNATPSRYVHRAPDRTYLDLWKHVGISYMEKMNYDFDPSEKMNAAHRMYDSPMLVERILRTEVAMKEKGYVPFVHAMPASSKVLMSVYEAIYPYDTKAIPFFKYLRPPEGEYMTSKKEILEHLPTDAKERSSDSRLISLSYALTSGIKPLESAASWGFINHFGKANYFPFCHLLDDYLKRSSLASHTALAILLDKGRALIRRYNRLKVGEFIVLGIPAEKVDRFVYDALPFNIPTGKKALNVALDPAKYKKLLLAHKTHMATLMMYNETTTPMSGMIMVSASDKGEVEKFCRGLTFTPLKEVDAYKELVSPVPTAFEREHEEKKETIDQELKKWATTVTQLLSHPSTTTVTFEESEEDEYQAGDSSVASYL